MALGDTLECRGHDTQSPLHATKRPSKRIVAELVLTLPLWPWLVSASISLPASYVA